MEELRIYYVALSAVIYGSVQTTCSVTRTDETRICAARVSHRLTLSLDVDIYLLNYFISLRKN
jgi:hypothetical protein